VCVRTKVPDDDGLTLFIQHESPGKEKESNWLPAPAGPFFMALRLLAQTRSGRRHLEASATDANAVRLETHANVRPEIQRK
jgi:hypothetical protein